MKKWDYYKDLIKKHSEEEIIDFLREGLHPYYGNNEEIYCPYDYHEYTYVLNNYSSQDPYRSKRLSEIVDEEPELSKGYKQGVPMLLSWKFVWVPEDTAKRKKLFSILQKTKFRKDEYDKLLKKRNPDKFENEEYLFYREGTKWYIKFSGKGEYIDHIDGIQYIAFLLFNPNEVYWSHDLYYAIKGHNPNPSPIKPLSEELTSSFPEDQSLKITKNVYGRIDNAYENLRKVSSLKGIVGYLSNRIHRKKRTLCFNPEPSENIKWSILL